MKNSVRIIYSIILLAFFCCSKKKLIEPAVAGSDYYPITKGKFVVYDVDSTIYSELPRDTFYFKYRIKEKIGETFTDNQGKQAIRLERFIKKFNPKKVYDSIAWTIKEVWMINADKTKIQVVEGNVRYTKLIFPTTKDASWDGNANNTNGQLLYSYEYIDKPEIINGNSLQNVTLVIQKFQKPLIYYQNHFEKYAKNIGLVHKEIIDVYSNKIILNTPIENRIEYGLIYKQTLVTYGIE